MTLCKTTGYFIISVLAKSITGGYFIRACGYKRETKGAKREANGSNYK